MISLLGRSTVGTLAQVLPGDLAPGRRACNEPNAPAQSPFLAANGLRNFDHLVHHMGLTLVTVIQETDPVMTFRFLAILLALSTSHVANGQSEADVVPKTMLEFLEPGMHLGVATVEGTTNVILHTYTQDDYAVAKDLVKQLGSSFKSATSVAETNATVHSELQAYISRLEPPLANVDHIMILPLIRTSFGKIVAVGDDFVLLALDGEQKRKRVIPKTSIATVYLNSNPIRFIDRYARLQTEVGK